jgi:hypothetical protein
MDAIKQTNRVKPRLHEALRNVERVSDISTFVDILEAINSPFGLSIAIKMRYGDFKGVLDTDVNPIDFNDVGQFADAYQSVKLISKYPYLKTGIDRAAVAAEKFIEAERACRETNRRFRLLRDGYRETGDSAVQAIISIAQRKISRLLGDLDLDRIADGFDWGPGASFGVRGEHTSAYNKFSGPLDVTQNCLILGLCCINSTPSWANAVAKSDEVPSLPVTVLPNALKLVAGNEIIFVPKNAKTDRVIAIEPSLNIYVQKGIGTFIRRKLRERAGIDLDDQTTNQRLAQYGSLTGELATIDLSMASDTISRELVRELLPEEWYGLLDSCRCHYGTMKHDNSIVRYEKFSSMGNGFTFELESLIFWALSQATLDQMRHLIPESALRVVSVYGDDLIINVECYEALLEVLAFCGFSANRSKSFGTGVFRESCGKDFFLGTDVRPLFIKERIDNVESIYRLANSIRRYAHRRNHFNGCDRRMAPVWSRLVARLPNRFRLFQSEGFGDEAIIGNFDESTPTVPRDGWEGYYVRVIHRQPFRVAFEREQFGYTTVLQRAGPLTRDGFNGRYDRRSRTFPKMGRVLVRTWYNLGPWV